MIHTRRLPNGLTLHLEPAPDVHSVALGFFVRAGSRHEPEALSGVSHFLEHLCFKSTRRRSASSLQREVDALGAEWNAFTGWEGSAYYLWVSSDRVKAAVDILSDMMRPRLAPDEVEKERQVILEEISMYEDSPEDEVMDDLFQMTYEGHPLGRRIVGTARSVRGIGRHQVAAYHRRFYRSDRLEFVATGNMAPGELTDLVRARCGRWRPGDAAGPQRPPRFQTGQRVITRPHLARLHLALALPAPPKRSPLSPVADILASYLGDEDNGRLLWTVKRRGLVDDVWMNYEAFTDAGLLTVYASLDPPDVGRALALIRKEIARVHAHVDPAALTRARRKAITDLVCDSENCLDRFEHLVNQIGAGARPRPLADEIQALERLSLQDVQCYLRRYPLDAEPSCVLLSGR
ncbi:MAG: insulinase family protein [Planctomycetes bacterium]|nr:insulinase family protein [Planctomycetota bacterium]